MLIVVVSIAACGGDPEPSGSPPDAGNSGPVLGPSIAMLPTGSSTRFEVDPPQGTDPVTVDTWLVNGIANGDAVNGTFAADTNYGGVYTAPASTPGTDPVTLSAKFENADGSQTIETAEIDVVSRDWQFIDHVVLRSVCATDNEPLAYTFDSSVTATFHLDDELNIVQDSIEAPTHTFMDQGACDSQIVSYTFVPGDPVNIDDVSGGVTAATAPHITYNGDFNLVVHNKLPDFPGWTITYQDGHTDMNPLVPYGYGEGTYTWPLADKIDKFDAPQPNSTLDTELHPLDGDGLSAISPPNLGCHIACYEGFETCRSSCPAPGDPAYFFCHLGCGIACSACNLGCVSSN